MRSLPLLVLLLALPMAACSGADDGAVVPGDDGVTGDDAEVIKASRVTIEESDNGKTVSMKSAGSLVVKLKGNRTAGYSWKVASTDRTFGYPEETSESLGPPGAVGAASMLAFTWKKNPLLRPGTSHTVKLEYKRPWETGPALKTFQFTVDVK